MPKRVFGPRADFAFSFAYCFACNDRWKQDRDIPFNLEVHEIARGAARKKSVKERCAWLLLCRRCHEDMGDLSKWPIARQLALKLIHDPEHFDLKRVNELRGRAPTAITIIEVSDAMQQLLTAFPWLQSATLKRWTRRANQNLQG